MILQIQYITKENYKIEYLKLIAKYKRAYCTREYNKENLLDDIIKLNNNYLNKKVNLIQKKEIN